MEIETLSSLVIALYVIVFLQLIFGIFTYFNLRNKTGPRGPRGPRGHRGPN